jgi:Ca2+-binding RTX toxin-like protein
VAHGNDAALTGTVSAYTGADVMNGGAGVDTVDYSGRSAPLSVSLCVDASKATGNTSLTTGGCGQAGSNGDGESAEGDEVINVEWVKGGSDVDTMTGGAADETFEGGAGDDVISGGAGNDTIYGDAGDDVLHGDAGDDYIDDTVTTNGNTIGGDAGDGDICIGATGDTITGCEL